MKRASASLPDAASDQYTHLVRLPKVTFQLLTFPSLDVSRNLDKVCVLGWRFTDDRDEEWTRRFDQFKSGRAEAIRGACAVLPEAASQMALGTDVVLVSAIPAGATCLPASHALRLLGLAVAHANGWRFEPDAVEKTPHRRLVDLQTAEERDREVAGAYRCSSLGTASTVVVLDDFVTRGATVNAVARAVRESNANVRTVVALALAKNENKAWPTAHGYPVDNDHLPSALMARWDSGQAMESEAARASLELLQRRGVGVVKVRQAVLAAAAPSSTAIFESFGRLWPHLISESPDGFKPITAEYGDAESLLEACDHFGIGVLSILDPGYPLQLRKIKDAPPILFVKGNRQALNMPAIAIVGTREGSEIGRKLARYAGKTAARSGLAVISGLALGIDTAAHKGAIAAKGVTIAVLAHGLDTVAPSSNIRLAEEIIDTNGVLISEHAPFVPARPPQFVQRNRIQSGMALASVMVESGIEGGAMHHARFAREQARTVVAILPPDTHSFRRDGGQQLVDREGARAVHTSDELKGFLAELRAAPVEAETLRSTTPRSATKRALLVDLDGTLVESTALDEARSARRWAECSRRLRETSPFPGVLEALRLLKSRSVQIAIVTASPSNYAKELLGFHGIPFDTLVAYHDVERPKPAPDGFLEAMRRLAVTADECIGLGDSIHDLSALNAAGVQATAAAWNVACHDPQSWWRSIISPDDLTSLLDGSA